MNEWKKKVVEGTIGRSGIMEKVVSHWGTGVNYSTTTLAGAAFPTGRR